MTIITIFENPPVPCRDFDWSAVWNNHDYENPNAPVGRGATEMEATRDLMDKTLELQNVL
jgi:hypothetical protein